ncbi:bifunctional DNA primase/polymerase [Actinosynnema sp. CA-248983]
MADQSYALLPAEQAKRVVLDAALKYADYGWRVAPGTTWTGSRWERLKNGTRQEVEKLRPLMAKQWATTDHDTIRRMWGPQHDLTPTIMLLTGGRFDVVAMPLDYGFGLRHATVFKQNSTPVIFRPDLGRAYFLTTVGTMPKDAFDLPGEGIEMLKPQSLILAPPAVLPNGGNVIWWMHPIRTDGKVIAFTEFDHMARSVFARPDFRPGGQSS